jgi:hypothetical protein
VQLPNAPACQIAVEIVSAKEDVNRNPIVALRDRRSRQGTGGPDNALLQGKSDREVFQIFWRPHHYGVRKAVVSKSNRSFLSDADQRYLCNIMGLAQ